MITHFFKSIWIAVRSFSLGLLAGLLLAPRKGSETRLVVHNRIMDLFDRAIPTSIHARGASSATHQQGRTLEKEEYWEGGSAPDDRPIDLEHGRN